MKSLLRFNIYFAISVVAYTHPICPTTVHAQQKEASPSSALLDEKAFDDSFSKLPTNISADSLTLNAKQRIFAYKGNVTVEQGDMKLTSKTLEGSYGEDNQIQKLIAKGDVRITKQEIEATGQQALYDAASATVVLSDNPQLKQGESLLTADRIKVFLNENRSQAEGAVRVTLVKGKDAGAPSFVNLGKGDEHIERETTKASVVKAQPEPKETAQPEQTKGTAAANDKSAQTSSASKSKPTTTKKKKSKEQSSKTKSQKKKDSSKDG